VLGELGPRADVDGGVKNALILMLVGCSGAEAPARPPAVGGPWESVEVTTDSPTVIVEKVSYRSGGLKIWGQVCRPKAKGPHKALLYAHGGFSGIADGLGLAWNSGTCLTLAEEGWVVIAPSYRGEDGSEGQIEICHGEVDDLLEMARIGFAQPYVDRARTVVFGGSHGGCITLRALQRGLKVQVAVDLFGPTDWASVYRYWVKLYGEDDPTLGLVRTAVGGTPEEVPEAYAKRSPIAAARALEGYGGDLLVLHGAQDELVPVEDSCRLVAAAGGFESYHVGPPPPACDLTWAKDLPSETWRGKRQAVIFDGAGHGLTVPIGDAMLGTAFAYVNAKVP
jgi:dienelactone hydrolase